MLHLAQVQQNQISEEPELRILATQESNNSWVLTTKEQILPSPHGKGLSEGLLVLVETNNQQEITNIQSARNWVLDFVEKYLTLGITPGFLEQEAERIEEWRQDLTLQSQELGRRQWEMEARREQIQSLEEEVKRKQKELEDEL
jgi:predicted ATP-grasp superfamily ATP-dependent carboligase